MIVVAGEALVDVFDHGAGDVRVTAGGGAFNTARALGRLGVPAAFLGHLSADAHGRELARALTADGVSAELVTVGPEPTTIAHATVDRGGVARYRFTVEGTAAPLLTPAMVPRSFGGDLEALHVGGLGLALEPIGSTLVELVLRERTRTVVVVDPNVRAGLVEDGAYRERLRTVIAASTIVKASDTDLEWVEPARAVEATAAAMLSDGASLVAVTLGAAGAFAVHRGLRVRVPSPEVEVVDTVGAGDAFGAALLGWLRGRRLLRRRLALSEGQLRSALVYACLAAALTCSRPGADPPTAREMAAALARRGARLGGG